MERVWEADDLEGVLDQGGRRYMGWEMGCMGREKFKWAETGGSLAWVANWADLGGCVAQRGHNSRPLSLERRRGRENLGVRRSEVERIWGADDLGRVENLRDDVNHRERWGNLPGMTSVTAEDTRFAM